MARGEAGIDASTGAGTVALERVEIVTRGEGRRRYSAEEKVRLVAETLRAGETVAAVSLRRGVCTSLLHRWRREARGEDPRRRRRAPRLLPVRLGTPDALHADPPAALPGPTVPAPALIEVMLRNGRVLRVTAATDVAVVARLASALEA